MKPASLITIVLAVVAVVVAAVIASGGGGKAKPGSQGRATVTEVFAGDGDDEVALPVTDRRREA
jgi:hypothetical protein